MFAELAVGKQPSVLIAGLEFMVPITDAVSSEGLLTLSAADGGVWQVLETALIGFSVPKPVEWKQFGAGATVEEQVYGRP